LLSSGVGRVCLPDRLHGRGNHESNRVRLRAASGFLFAKRMEHSGLSDRSSRVSNCGRVDGWGHVMVAHDGGTWGDDLT